MILKAEGGGSNAELKMRNALFTLSAILLFAFTAKAQTSSLTNNTSLAEKQESVIYKNFAGECDFMIAYIRESYWWGNRRFYQLLALKKGAWYKGYLSSQLLKSGKWTYPRVKFKEVDPDSAAFIAKYLDDKDFYKINQDSLNIDKKTVGNKVQRFSISDGVNYKFEILFGNNLSIIQAYSPDLFLKNMPEITTRAIFIEFRDWFEKKYDTLEQVDNSF